MGEIAFAFTNGTDERGGHYQGLWAGQNISLPDGDAPGLLVEPKRARSQLDAPRSASRPMLLLEPGRAMAEETTGPLAAAFLAGGR